MSEFEYVSVAVALAYSFAVARIVGAFPSVLAVNRRYWVHGVWTLVLLMAAISTWWTIWDLREVEWNPIRFTWVLIIPALIHLRVGVLVSENPAVIASWRDHYYENRMQFFGVGLLIALNYAVLPWVMGVVPWFAGTDLHFAFASLLTISVLGLVSANPTLHGVLASVNLIMILAGMAAGSR
jgi:hypothetical protein